MVSEHLEKKAVDGVVSLLGKGYEFLKVNKKSKDIDSGARRYMSSARDIVMVKTFWQFEKSVDLRTFFVPLNIEYRDAGELVRNEVGRLDDLPQDSCILIEGIAGQGKSILLRYLCAKEFELGRTLPVFIELRKWKGSLFDLILHELKIIDPSMSVELVESLLKLGCVTVFLDAFDEVDEESYQDLVSAIDDLCRKYKGVKTLVTSRPNFPIQYSTSSRNIRLSYLSKKSRSEIVKKICVNEENRKVILKIINDPRKFSSVEGVLLTPLSVSLFVTTYSAYQSIPESSSEFYDELFAVMMKRHDGAKPGYNRVKKSKLKEVEMEKAFCAFCYYSKFKRTPSKRSEAIEFADNALKRISSNESGTNLLEDIVKVSCLYLKDGHEYSFLHKSVQEYFAARFIARQVTDDNSKKFYSNLLKSNNSAWKAELNYLGEIDAYRHAKYYDHPRALRQLEVDTIEDFKPKNTYTFLEKYAHFCSVEVNAGNYECISVTHRATKGSNEMMVDGLFSLNWKFLKNKKVPIESNIITVNGPQLLKYAETKKIVRDGLYEIVNGMLDEAINSLRLITTEDNRESVDSFDI